MLFPSPTPKNSPLPIPINAFDNWYPDLSSNSGAKGSVNEISLAYLYGSCLTAMYAKTESTKTHNENCPMDIPAKNNKDSITQKIITTEPKSG